MTSPSSAPITTRPAARAAQYALGLTVAAAFTGAVWLLPPGNVLFPAALLAVLTPALLARAVAPGQPQPAPAQPVGAFFGLTLALLPLPFTGLPYRPDLLLPILAAFTCLAHVFLIMQLRSAGWKTAQAALVALGASAIALLAAAIGLWL
jgi:hypothetical protein